MGARSGSWVWDPLSGGLVTKREDDGSGEGLSRLLAGGAGGFHGSEHDRSGLLYRARWVTVASSEAINACTYDETPSRLASWAESTTGACWCQA